MKQTKSIIGICLCLFLTTFSLRAQVPGYMGKKTVMGYGFIVHPALGSQVMGFGDNPLNIKHEFYLETAIAKRAAFGGAVQFYRYVYNNVDLVNPGQAYGYYQYSGVRPSGSYEISAQNFMLYNKFFMRGYLAPWGRYFTLGAVYTNYTAEYRPSQMYVRVDKYNYNTGTNSGQITLNNFGPVKQSFSFGDILVGIGKSRIHGNRFVVDGGCHFQVISTMFMLINTFSLGEAVPMNTYIQHTSRQRVTATNRFNFYLKLGILL